MKRLLIILPFGLVTLAAAPAMAEDFRDLILSGVAERTEARVAARDPLPPGDRAEERLGNIDARLTARDERGAPRIRPDIRLTRQATRIEGRLSQ